MIRLIACLLFPLLFATPTVAQIGGEGRLWGLAIGIDRYASQGGTLQDLRGAVSDARDVADALTQAGAAQVMLLVNEAAHRDAIFAAVDDLARRARPGDTIVISYAGHGGREPSADLVAEPDGYSEVTLLSGFRPTAPHNYQRIFDHEWRAMVRRLSDFTVVMVFDSCHSGTANRTAELRGALSQGRFAQYGAITDDQVPPASRLEGGASAVLDHEVFLGATRDDLVVPEIAIGGAWRGALSVAFAQALRGRADANGDGVLNRGELADFIQANVHTLSAARQFPQVVYPDFGVVQGDNRPLLGRQIIPTASVETPEVCTSAALAATPARLSVRIAPDARMASAPLSAMPEVIDAAAGEPADLTLLADPQNNLLVAFGPTGDRAALLPAHAARPLTADEAGALAARWRLSTVLDQLAGCAPPLVARLVGPQGEGALHRWGDRLSLHLPPREGGYLTMIVVNGTGAVELLYPQDSDPERVGPAQPFQLDFDVTEPFGTDLLIILASDTLQSSLHRQLRQFDPLRHSPETGLLIEALAATLARGQQRIAVLPLHTAAR